MFSPSSRDFKTVLFTQAQVKTAFMRAIIYENESDMIMMHEQDKSLE